jgi:hypothetical protein
MHNVMYEVFPQKVRHSCPVKLACQIVNSLKTLRDSHSFLHLHKLLDDSKHQFPMNPSSVPSGILDVSSLPVSSGPVRIRKYLPQSKAELGALDPEVREDQYQSVQ